MTRRCPVPSLAVSALALFGSRARLGVLAARTRTRRPNRPTAWPSTPERRPTRLGAAPTSFTPEDANVSSCVGTLDRPDCGRRGAARPCTSRSPCSWDGLHRLAHRPQSARPRPPPSTPPATLPTPSATPLALATRLATRLTLATRLAGRARRPTPGAALRPRRSACRRSRSLQKRGAADQRVRGLPRHEVATVAQQERADVVGEHQRRPCDRTPGR